LAANPRDRRTAAAQSYGRGTEDNDVTGENYTVRRYIIIIFETDSFIRYDLFITGVGCREGGFQFPLYIFRPQSLS